MGAAVACLTRIECGRRAGTRVIDTAGEPAVRKLALSGKELPVNYSRAADLVL